MEVEGPGASYDDAVRDERGEEKGDGENGGGEVGLRDFSPDEDGGF